MVNCKHFGCNNNGRFQLTVKIGDKTHDLTICYTHFYNSVFQGSDKTTGRLITKLVKNVFGEPCNYEITSIWDMKDECHKLEKSAVIPVNVRINA